MTNRQQAILELVKKEGTITGDQIADHFNVTRATLRADLSVLTSAGFIDARPRVGYYYTGLERKALRDPFLDNPLVRDFKAVPIVVKETSSVYEAICTMFLEDVGTLYVVKEDNSLAGVVSRKDLLKTAIGKMDLQEVPVGMIMTRIPNIIVCYEDDPLIEVAQKLISFQIDSVPVVRVREGGSKDNPVYDVVGRITKTTITRRFVDLANGLRV